MALTASKSSQNTTMPDVMGGEMSLMAKMAVVQAARLLGGAVITIAITVVVVNEVLTVNAINNTTGPFTGVIDSLDTTGVAAMSLLVVGLLVYAGQKIMGFMGGGGGGF